MCVMSSACKVCFSAAAHGLMTGWRAGCSAQLPVVHILCRVITHTVLSSALYCRKDVNPPAGRAQSQSGQVLGTLCRCHRPPLSLAVAVFTVLYCTGTRTRSWSSAAFKSLFCAGLGVDPPPPQKLMISGSFRSGHGVITNTISVIV